MIAIKEAADDDDVWTEEIHRLVSGTIARVDQVGLTNRDWEVLKQIALGLTNKEIGLALGISYETLKEHVQHLLRKLKMKDRTQVAVWAVKQDLV